MKSQEKFFTRKMAPQTSARMVETIFGCKWSLTVYHLLENGINRPGEMVRSVDGLSTKVLNQCLKRNVDFGILDKIEYNEIPPRVEYTITEFGEKFVGVLAQNSALQEDIDAQQSQNNN